MIYTNSNLHIDSDFQVRAVREFEQDLDLLIAVDDRTLNLYLNHEKSFLSKRIQLPAVKNILIRVCTIDSNNVGTIHFLRTIDLNSSIVNFEFNYTNHMIYIKDKEFYIDFRFSKLLMG